MLTGEEIGKLAMLLDEKGFHKSSWAGAEYYLTLVRDREAARKKLLGKLDERRAELLEELLRLQGLMEYEQQLYYLHLGLELGGKLAGGKKIPWEKISWEKRNFP